MRVAYLSEDMGVHDFRFLKKLSESGHDTHVATYHIAPTLPEPILSLPRLTFHHLHQPTYAFSQYQPGNRYLAKARRLLAFRRCLAHLKRTLKAVQPDVLHAGWVQSDGWLAALSGFHPFLLMPWGSDILLNPDSSVKARLIAKYVLARADMVICDCEVVKRKIGELSNFPQEKIRVFPWGIDLDLFRPLDSHSLRHRLGLGGKRVVISTRSLKPVYRVGDLIVAFPGVRDRVPDAVLVIVGAGDLRRGLEEEVARLDLSDHVRFVGTVKNHELPAYLCAAELYVSTSSSDGSSLSLMEAMACSLPVVVTDIPANREWVTDGANGYVVPVGQPEALAARIGDALCDPDRLRRMGAANLEKARDRADWDKNFAILEEVYEQLVTGSS